MAAAWTSALFVYVASLPARSALLDPKPGCPPRAIACIPQAEWMERAPLREAAGIYFGASIGVASVLAFVGLVLAFLRRTRSKPSRAAMHRAQPQVRFDVPATKHIPNPLGMHTPVLLVVLASIGTTLGIGGVLLLFGAATRWQWARLEPEWLIVAGLCAASLWFLLPLIAWLARRARRNAAAGHVLVRSRHVFEASDIGYRFELHAPGLVRWSVLPWSLVDYVHVRADGYELRPLPWFREAEVHVARQAFGGNVAVDAFEQVLRKAGVKVRGRSMPPAPGTRRAASEQDEPRQGVAYERA